MTRISDHVFIAINERATWEDLNPEQTCPACSLAGTFDTRGDMWRCGACNNGGDIVTYWQTRNGMTVNAAVHDLANRYGVR